MSVEGGDLTGGLTGGGHDLTGHLADWAFDLGGGRSDECVQVVWECCRWVGTRGEHQRWSEGARREARREGV